MADVKISNLPSYAVGVNPGPNDLLPIVDTATNTTRKVPLSNLVPSPVTPFNATLTAAYTVSSLPFYNSSQQVTATRTLTITGGVSTSIAATISDGVTTINITSPGTATTVALNNTGLTLGGSASGTGSSGISGTVNFTGSVPAVSIYTPAFFTQTANSAPPVFTTASTQTAGAAQGSTITYPLPSASSNYNWICTQRALSNLILQSPFGGSVLVPDVTAPTQTISGQVFNVFGWTALSTISASILQVN